ncbi:MAG: hypothetical protein JO147_04655 [Actinobacteria bacterium]|nr:hypothetical protein [Actinomycetota bacterium]
MSDDSRPTASPAGAPIKKQPPEPPLPPALAGLGVVLIALVSIVLAALEVLLVPSYIGSVIFPITVVVAIAGNLGLPWLIREIQPTRWSVCVPAVCWVLVVLGLGFTSRPEGDVLLPGYGDGEWVAYALLLIGALAAAIGVIRMMPPVSSSRR